MTPRRFLACFLMLMASAGVAQAQPANATLDDFTWLAGQWTGPALGGRSEELWTRPDGGSMQGMYRLVKDGTVVFYELLTLTEKNGSVVLRLKHFNADLTGWEEKATVLEFPLMKITPTEAHFDGMIFTHAATDAFSVRLKVGDKKTGAVREELFTYTRVAP
jgi:hypothetical protein